MQTFFALSGMLMFDPPLQVDSGSAFQNLVDCLEMWLNLTNVKVSLRDAKKNPAVTYVTPQTFIFVYALIVILHRHTIYHERWEGDINTKYPLQIRLWYINYNNHWFHMLTCMYHIVYLHIF